MTKSFSQGRKRKQNARGQKRKQHPDLPSADGKKKKKRPAARKSETFNIDKCVSTTSPQPDVSSFQDTIEVKVTGVDLRDDHTHGGSTVIVDKNNTVNSDSAENGNNKICSDNNCSGSDNHDVIEENQKQIDLKEKNSTPVTHDEKEGEEKIKLTDTGTNGNGNGNDGDKSTNKEENNVVQPEEDVERKEGEISLVKTESNQIFVRIIREKSGQLESSRKKMNKKAGKKYVNLPNGNCGDGIVNPFPKDEVDDKYWAQRKRFFSKFDDGIQLDKESWYSVTPEAIANHIAKRMAEDIGRCENDGKNTRSGGGAVILDAFCGCGGNAIGFAKLDPSNVRLIICVDIDRYKLRMAANNASIYGINTDRILFIQADSTFVMEQCYKDGALVDFDKESKLGVRDAADAEIYKGYKIGGYDLLPPNIDTVFLSPPWGGPEYINANKKGYTLKSICIKQWNDKRIDGEGLLVAAKNASKTKHVTYFLPRTLNIHQMAKSAFRAGYHHIEVEKNVLNGKLKTITVYLKNN